MTEPFSLGLTPGAQIGILAGCAVFVVTIGAVFSLLYFGGSFDRMKQEAMGLAVDSSAPKALLYDELLEKAKSLPLKPSLEGFQGDGVKVSLRPASALDAEELHRISNGERKMGLLGSSYDPEHMIWKYLPSGPHQTAAELHTNLVESIADRGQAFVIVDRDTSQIIGMISILNNDPRNLKVEIGNLWVTPAYRSTYAATEATYILLSHLFKQNYRRVEMAVDAQNVPGRKSAKRFGFTLEGVLRKNKIVKNANQDTAVFSLVNNEWPAVNVYLQDQLQVLFQKYERARGKASKKSHTMN